MNDQPKFNFAEIILGAEIALVIDGVSAIADFFSSGFLGFVVQALAWLLFTFWFTMKGVKATSSFIKRFLLPIAAQLIPFIPTMIFTFLITVYMENHPERFGFIERVAGAASGKPKTT